MRLNLVLKSMVFCLILSQASFAASNMQKICPKGTDTCVQNLTNYPLFDNPHLIAANYVPILPLRAFAHADIYKAKKNLRMVREFYVRDLAGNFSKPYEKIDLLVTVKAKGLFGREILASGTLNEFQLEYKNIATFSLPKNAHMKVEASLDGLPILDLDVVSDGNKMTNKVQGSFLGKTVDYLTEWRETKGTLAGHSYNLHTEGVTKEPERFKAVTKGKINSTEISGTCEMLEKNHYKSIENYGPILVKTDIRVLE